MDLFVEKIPSTLFSMMTPKITPKGEKCVIKLYHMLLKAQKQSESITQHVKIIDELSRVKKYVKNFLSKYSVDAVYYFPERMMRKVEENGERIISVVFELPKRTVRIYFIMNATTFSDFSNPKRLNTYLSQLKLWFSFLDEVAPGACAKTLDIKIYLTDEKKTLPIIPGETIGVEHVNSAFSNICQRDGEIVIYRKEEWFKVLIHESLHNYGIDFTLMDQTKMATHLFKVFPIGANIDNAIFSETYTETWAELLNIAFISLDLMDSEDSNPNTFSLYFHFLTQIELLHSLSQTQKILQHFDLSYKSLLERKSAEVYKQSSHVFEYYILKTVLLVNYGEFLCWADDNMRDLIVFPDDEKKLTSFCDLLERLGKKDFSLRNEKITSTIIELTHDENLRMTICEI
jgi:hypothetical protein